jgi:MORN repeat
MLSAGKVILFLFTYEIPMSQFISLLFTHVNSTVIDDVISGKGRLVAANGDVYEGQFEANVRCGRGRISYATGGGVYDGTQPRQTRNLILSQFNTNFNPEKNKKGVFKLEIVTRNRFLESQCVRGMG